MKIDAQTPDLAAIAEMGKRLRALRLARNLSQDDLAREAGVGRATLQRFERGDAATSVKSLIRILRVLDETEGLDLLIPELRPSPLQELGSRPRERRRAGSRKSPDREKPAPGGRTWGDEGAGVK